MIRSILTILVVCCVGITHAIDYVFTGLGRGSANAVNNLGQIVGSRSDSDNQTPHVFRWTPGSGFYEPFSHPQHSLGSSAYAINNAGDFCGTIEGGGFRIDGTGYHPAIPPRINTSFITVWDINDRRFAVGTYSSDPIPTGFYWDPDYLGQSERGDNLQEILPATVSAATGINNAGWVTGYTRDYHAFIWQYGSTSFLYTGPVVAPELGHPSINDAGLVVGASSSGAFIWNPVTNETQYIGTLGFTSSAAQAINNNGWVVGELASVGNHSAFLWTPNDGMIDLGRAVGITGSNMAYGINDRNQIVGMYNTNGEWHIAVWTPVPEPSTFLGFSVFSMLLVSRLRRR
jgi:probable HAF family extracellular repeat protein